MDTNSDVTVTPTVTCTISPVFTMSWSDKVRQMKVQNPKVTPTPSKARQTPITHVNHKFKPVSKPTQSFSSSGIFTSKPCPMTQSSVPKDLDKIPSPFKDKIFRNIKGAKRFTDTADKDVKILLKDKLDDFINTYMPED